MRPAAKLELSGWRKIHGRRSPGVESGRNGTFTTCLGLIQASGRAPALAPKSRRTPAGLPCRGMKKPPPLFEVRAFQGFWLVIVVRGDETFEMVPFNDCPGRASVVATPGNAFRELDLPLAVIVVASFDGIFACFKHAQWHRWIVIISEMPTKGGIVIRHFEHSFEAHAAHVVSPDLPATLTGRKNLIRVTCNVQHIPIRCCHQLTRRKK